VPWLVLGLLFFATTMVTTTGLIVAKRTIEIALCTLAAAVLNVGLCIALIPRHGIGGAAVATAAAYAVQAVLVIWRGQRADRAPFAAGRVAAVFAVAAPYLALGWIHIRPAVLSALVKVAILATLPVVLVATRIVHHGELRRMIDSVRFRMTTRFGRRILEADEEENADVWPPRPSPPPG
jgi:O-antigen/teichoic acid export membrane protein